MGQIKEEEQKALKYELKPKPFSSSKALFLRSGHLSIAGTTPKTKEPSTLDIPISLSFIERITLSPWMHSNLSRYVKQTLWSIKGCEKLEILRSTLISNEEWKELGEDAE